MEKLPGICGDSQTYELFNHWLEYIDIKLQTVFEIT